MSTNTDIETPKTHSHRLLAALVLALHLATPRFTRDNSPNPNLPEIRRQRGANSHPLTPTHPLTTHPKWAKALNLRNPPLAEPHKLRLLLAPLRLKHSTVHFLPRPLADKAPHARRVRAVVSRWCWKSQVAGANWRIRARLSQRRDTTKPVLRGRTSTAACCLSSAGRRVAIGVLSLRSQVFWVKRVLGKLSVHNVGRQSALNVADRGATTARTPATGTINIDCVPTFRTRRKQVIPA